MFPISNESGKVIAFTGRTLSADEKAGPKYLNSPETPIYSKSRVLFNLDKAKDAIRKLDYAILVEGQMDCIAVYTAGFHNVIASSGTAFTEVQARLMGRFSKNIVVNFDPDTAGAAAAERSLALLISEDFQIKVLTLESGFDPDLFIRRKGVPAYADALAHSQKYFDYLVDRARALHPVRNAGGQGQGTELFVATHSAGAKPDCARRVGERDFTAAGNRFGGNAAGVAARGGIARDIASEVCRRRVDRRRAGAGAGAGEPGLVAGSAEQPRGSGPGLRAGAAGALRVERRATCMRGRRRRR